MRAPWEEESVPRGQEPMLEFVFFIFKKIKEKTVTVKIRSAIR